MARILVCDDQEMMRDSLAAILTREGHEVVAAGDGPAAVARLSTGARFDLLITDLKMPKMTGPQSDKDVQLYREMAGQVGDPMVPRAQRQAAAATIRKLNEKYAGMPQGSSKNDGSVIDFGSLK